MTLSWPGPVDHPPEVAGLAVTGSRHRTEAARVLDALDGQGRPVAVVVLTPGAGLDGAARDRFAQAVEALTARLDGPVTMWDRSGPLAEPPWVVLPAGTPDDLLRVLAQAALPPDADEVPRAGPRFRLPWAGLRGWRGRAPWAGTRVPRWRRLWWLVGVLAMMALLGLLLSMCQAPPTRQPTPGPGIPSGQSDPAPGQDGPGQEQPGQQGSDNARYA